MQNTYHTLDGSAFVENPLVLGYEIKLSSTDKPKTRCELCRTLAGNYPVWFKWGGWHNECICFKIPILMSDEMMAKYQRLVARGEDTPDAVKELQKSVRIEDTSANFKSWIMDNITDDDTFFLSPHFIRDNFPSFQHIQQQTNL